MAMSGPGPSGVARTSDGEIPGTGVVCLEAPKGAWPRELSLGRRDLFPHAPLVRLTMVEKFLEERFGLSKKVFAKLELHETSTFKDRAAAAQVRDAKARGCKKVVTCSSGNWGESIAWFAKKSDLTAVIVVPQGHEIGKLRDRVERVCGGVLKVVHSSDYAAALKESERIAEDGGQEFYNANPAATNGKPPHSNSDIQRDAYSAISEEIVQQLAHRGQVDIAVVACPGGNGTLVAGLRQGFRTHGSNPRLVLATSENPMIEAFRQGKKRCEPLTRSIRVSHVNEAGAGSVALDGVPALEAVRDSGGKVAEVSDSDIEAAKKLLEEAIKEVTKKRVRLHPFAAASLAGLVRETHFMKTLEQRESQSEGAIVLVLTGVLD